FGAIYLLFMFQKVFFGPLDKKKNGQLKDLSAREIAVFAPLVAAVLVLGVFPRPLLHYMEASVQQFESSFRAKRAEPDCEARLQGTPCKGQGIDAALTQLDQSAQDMQATLDQMKGAAK